MTAAKKQSKPKKEKTPQKPKTIGCNSGARQLVNFANDVALTAGGSALVIGGLGAEPVAAGLAAAAGFADVVSLTASAYIYLTERDAGPLKSSFSGAAFGAVGGVAAKVFGGSSKVGLGGVRVTHSPTKQEVESSKYVSGQASTAVLSQRCPN